jgi:glycerol-3-phosphate dehydrogenase subunit B
LTAGGLLAQKGRRVLLLAHGAGALLLASGCIDVLGFQPTDSREPVKNPLNKLHDVQADRPEHPYNFVGRQNIESGLQTFLELVNQQGLDYRGAADHNWLLPGAAGAVHPTCLAPASLANGELSSGGRMLIVGFSELRDFYPALISQNLNAQDLDVQTASLTVELPAPFTGKMNITPIELARAFEQTDFRRKLVKAVKKEAKGYSRVGFPAVLGLTQHLEVMADLKKQLGKTVFEISTLPPSVPGRRLFEALKQAFLQAGGRLIIGSKVVDGTIENGRVAQVRFETSNRLRSARADNYILATGGIYGGGVQTNDVGQVWEPIFGLPIQADSNRHKWFAEKFIALEGQPFARYGIAVNQQLNPVNGRSDAPLAENLYIAGASIAGADWTRGRTGDGVAVTTAAAIAKRIED